eukprot:3316091-Rhodomonas_salina.1
MAGYFFTSKRYCYSIDSRHCRSVRRPVLPRIRSLVHDRARAVRNSIWSEREPIKGSFPLHGHMEGFDLPSFSPGIPKQVLGKDEEAVVLASCCNILVLVCQNQWHCIENGKRGTLLG